MADNNKIGLSEWIRSFMVQRNQEDYHNYATFEQVRDAAVRVLRDLNYSTNNNISAQVIDIINNSYVQLPNAFLSLSFIGILDNNNKYVYPLYPRERINTAGEVLLDDQGQPLLDDQGVELLSELVRSSNGTGDGLAYDSPYFYNYFYSNGIGRQYGASGGNNVFGYYKLNLDDDRIDLEVNQSVDKVVLEFVADPFMQADPKINTKMEEALSDGVYYYLIKRMSNVPQSEKMQAERRWVNSRRIGIARMKQLAHQEMMFQSRVNNQSAPRY